MDTGKFNKRHRRVRSNPLRMEPVNFTANRRSAFVGIEACEVIYGMENGIRSSAGSGVAVQIEIKEWKKASEFFFNALAFC